MNESAVPQAVSVALALAANSVRVCDGLSCEMAGARELLAALPARLGSTLGIAPGVRAASCLGRCDHAPAVMVGENAIAPACGDDVVAAFAGGAWHEGARSHLGYVDYAAYRAEGGYRLLQQCVGGEREAGSVLRVLEEARLWTAPAARSATLHVGAGVPGSFADRALLHHDPHRILEGLLIACWATGLDEAAIELHGDLGGDADMLRQELETLAQELPLAGVATVHLRGASNPRPHDGSVPAQRVEPLYWVRERLEQGADAIAQPGRRWVGVSGRVREPGLKCVPAGSTVQDLIDEHCGGMLSGHRFYAYLPGGALGGIVPASNDRIPLAADGIASGDVVVLSDHDSAVGAARNLLRGFVRDAGDGAVAAAVARLIEHPHWDRAALTELAALLRHAADVASARPAASMLDCIAKDFRAEVE